MCVTNNFIEKQAYEISEEIRQNSLYKVVKVEVLGNNLGLHNQNEQWTGKELISKIILEDKEGVIYSINPDLIGLRFSKGEITYKEYKQLQKKDDIKGFSFFIFSIGFVIIMMFTMMKLFV